MTRTCLCGGTNVEDPVKKYHLFYRRKKPGAAESESTFDKYEETRQEEGATGSGGDKQQ